MRGARRWFAPVVLAALVLASMSLLPDRGADEPPPPSAADSFSARAAGRILLSRIYANAARDDEFVELENDGGARIDLSGWSLTDREDTAVFPAGTLLGPGHHLVATRNATSYEED